MGGLSSSSTDAEESGGFYDDNYNSDVGIVGLSHQYFLGDTTYIKSTLSHSTQNIGFQYFKNK